jgi:hypothetical protein
VGGGRKFKLDKSFRQELIVLRISLEGICQRVESCDENSGVPGDKWMAPFDR